MHNRYALGYASQRHEIRLDRLCVQGAVPSWLAGTLVRNGPGQFEVGQQEFRHWFDGLAMLHAFSFRDGQVSYANRFLQSKAYRAANESGRIVFAEFATDPCQSIFRRIKSLFTSKLTDNCSVNLAKVAGRFVAMTETPLAVEFDPATLATLGGFDYGDALGGQVTTAHPHQDFARAETINYLLKFSFRSAYQIYAIPGGQTARRLVATLAVKEPGYMHSFAITENYVVLAEFPLVVKPLQLLLGGKSFIESYRWKPERGTRLIVVDRRDGKLRGIYETEAFFAFHHVNAFERDGEIVLDLATYRDPSVIDKFYLDKLRNAHQDIPTAELRRYRIKLDRPTTMHEVVSNEAIELPRINYRQHNTKDYSVVYGISTRADSPQDVADQLVRVDVRKGEVARWSATDCYPGEGVFVPAPDATGESDGVVLSVVLDVGRGTSFLLVLDATTFQEIARAEVPQFIPFGIHGQFFGGVG